MRRYLNLFFTELAALFLSCLLISCSALFNSSDTGSVSFSLSSDQLRSIVTQPQSARTLMQGDEPIVEDEGELRHLVLQLAVYSYDFNTFKSGQLRYSYYEIEAGVNKSITLDEIPVGQYALVALLYFDDSWQVEGEAAYYMRKPLYCGAEESIYVNPGSQSVAVTMIDFRGAFIKDYEPLYEGIPEYNFEMYLETAVGTGEDSDFGQMCICASEDKPFYALLTENYGIVSIGLVEGSPKRNFPIRELATVNSDLSNFAFLKNTNVITVDVTASPSETEGYYDMTYEINFHGKTLVFNGTEESGGDEPGGGGDDPSGGSDGFINFIYTMNEVEYRNLPTGASDYVIYMCNKNDFSDGVYGIETRQFKDFDCDPYTKLSFMLKHFQGYSGLDDLNMNSVYFRLKFQLNEKEYHFDSNIPYYIDYTSMVSETVSMY